MKKSIFISLCMVMAATAVLTSCKKDNDTVSFRATISTYQNNGKVYIDNNRFANWIDEDEVLINGAPYTVEVEGSGDSRIASINGVTAVTSGGYYAIYPAECALPTPTTGTIPTSGFPQILLPQVQLYRSTTIDGQTVQRVEAPMAAYCSADRQQAGLDFTNLCSLLKVTLPSAMEVGYITVSSSNKPLWGKATISGTNSLSISSPEIASLYATDNTVTLDCTSHGLHSEGSGASTGTTSAGPFYIVLPPATDVEGLTVDVYVFDGNNTAQTRRTIKKYSKTTSNTIAITSNNIYITGELPTTGETVPDVPFPNLGSGEFSVSDTKKVRFALGNLQYQASTKTWRFAQNQWISIKDALGNTRSNETTRSTQEEWIDLFCWGSSGYNGCYPWLKSTHAPGRNNDNQLGNFSGTDYDWGINSISNGGNQPRKWRTLSGSEWYYLMWSRNNYNNLRKVGKLNDINGMFIMPDNGPNVSTYQNTSGKIEIQSTDETWQRMSAAGAIFLPATGYRSGSSVHATTSFCYWASSSFRKNITTSGNSIYYYNSNPQFTYQNFEYGLGVRLARDVN